MAKEVLILLSAALVISGCWYSFSERAFPHIKTVGVVPFENETQEYDVASYATELLTQKLSGSSTYELASPEAADAFVKGRITSYERKVNTYDENENPIDYVVRVRATVSFVERATERILWQATVEGYHFFPADGDESEAKKHAVEMLIEKIYDRLRSG